MPQTIQIFNANQVQYDLEKSGINIRTFTSSIHNLFHINRIEDYLSIIKFPLERESEPHKLTVHSFFFLVDGESERRKGLSKYTFGSNTFFFTPALEITSHDFISKKSNGFYVHFHIDGLFSTSVLRKLLSEFSFLKMNCFPLVQIDDKILPQVISLLHRLEIEYNRGAKANLDIIRAYLITLFIELNQYVDRSDTSSQNDAATTLIEAYKIALSENIETYQKVADYANLLSVSPNHLNKCTRQVLNKTALDLIHEMQMLEAKVMLKQTSLSIGEIAYKIGRTEPTDFARFFKRKSGVTPKAYREHGISENSFD